MGAAPTAGPTSLIFGTSRNFGGGGGGGDWQTGTQAGGAGGGGGGGVEIQQGASYTNALANAGGAGVANTGGGGGGGATNYGFGGRGGSGIVVVRYLAPAYKTSTPSNPGMNYGETTTISTSGTPFSGITRKMQWQASYDTGTTWTNLDSGTISNSTSYVTPVETIAALTAFQFRVIITDTTTSYTFTTISDTSTLVFFLLPTETDTAISLNGGQYVSSPAINSPTGSITIEVWTKPNVGACSSSNVYGNVIYKPNAYNIYCNNGFWYANTGNGSSMSGTAKAFPYKLIEGDWVHLAIAISGSNLYMFYNGQLVETGVAQTVTANSSQWYVGSQGTANTYLNGYVDEFRIWNSIRTEAQIQSDMVSNPTITDPNLSTYFDFNEGSGNVAYDRDALYISPNTMQLVSNSGNISWAAIESSTVSGNYTTVQFPRSIITQKGGWKIPVQVKSVLTLIVSGGGGGGVNAGAGGGGGGALKGVAALKSTKGPAKIQVGMGGYGGLKTNATAGGRNGFSSVLSNADSTVNAQVNGGSGGYAHWSDNPCNSGPTPSTGVISGGNIQPGYVGFSDTTTYVGGAGGAIPASSGLVGNDGGAGFTSTIFNGAKLFGGGAGSGSWSNSALGGVGGGDGGNAYGGRGGTGATSGDYGLSLTGNGGGGAGNTACTVIASPGGSGTVYLKYLNLAKPNITGPKSDTYTVGTVYKFAVSETVTNVGLTRTYQWQVTSDGGATWTNAVGGSGMQSAKYNSDTLTVGMNGPLYQFRCEVTESDGSGISVFANSDTATLLLLAQPTITGADSITSTYGTAASSTYIAADGTPSRKITTLPGSGGGLLDYGFNGTSFETMTFGAQTASDFNALLPLSNGKMLAGGSAIISAKATPVIVKVDATGALDPSFGTNGKVITNFTGGSFINVMAADTTTGQIYIAGPAQYSPNNGRWMVARFSATGVLDTTFNGIGYETITLFNNENAGNNLYAIFPQANGQIYLAGSAWDTALNQAETSTVLRLNNNGSIDTSFGTNGYARFKTYGGYSHITDIKVLSDGKILVAGSGETTTIYSASLLSSARLLSNGTLDSTYGAGGKATFSPPCSGYCIIESVARIAGDNSIYFATRTIGSPNNLFVGKATSTGILDTSFATNGFAIETFTATPQFLSMDLTSDSRVVVGSMYYTGTYYVQSINMYSSLGARVSTFGNGGLATLNSVNQGWSTPTSNGQVNSNRLKVDVNGGIWQVGLKGSVAVIQKVIGNTFGNVTTPSSIVFDTSTTDRLIVRIDTATPAGVYYQTLFVTDTASAVGYKTILINVNKAPGFTISVDTTTKSVGYDTSTSTNSFTSSGLLAGDTVTLSYKYRNNTETLTVAPQKVDTWTVVPTVATISNGTISNGVLSNYLSVTYNNGKLIVTRGKQSNFAIVATDSTTAGGKPSNFIYAQAGASQKIGFIGVMETAVVTLSVSGTNCSISASDSLTITTTNGAAATCTLSATVSASANYDSAVASSVILYFISYTNSRDNQTPGGGAVIGLTGGSPLDFITQIPMTINYYRVNQNDGSQLWIVGSGFSSIFANNIVRIGRSGLSTVVTGADANNLFVTIPGAGGYTLGTNIGRISITIGSNTVYAQDIWVAGQPATYDPSIFNA